EVLLGYLPSAEDEIVAEAIRTALTQVAVRDGKTEPLLITALRDPSTARRAGAGAALARAGVPDQQEAVRKLLTDRDPLVRLHVGLALAARKEREAIPALIGLLDQLPTTQTWPIEDLLYRLADDKVPVRKGEDQAARRRYREAWVSWWDEHGAKLDLAR